MKTELRLLKGYLDEDGDDIVALGRLDLAGIQELKIGLYQRENLSARSNRPNLLDEALLAGERFPAIVLGMRGQNFQSEKDGFTLKDSVYIIDGYQRVCAIIRFVEKYPDRVNGLKIDAQLFFKTDHDFEKAKFHRLNVGQKKVSINVILRNERDRYSSIVQIYALSLSVPDSILCKRVQWGQIRKPGELLTAAMIVRVMTKLLSHAPAETGEKTSVSSGPDAMMHGLQIRVNSVGLMNFRKAVGTFFELVDECWGIKLVEDSASRPQLRPTLLLSLADVLSSHKEFWTNGGKVLYIPSIIRKKLKKFPLVSPEHTRTAMSGGAAARNFMAMLLIKHMNENRPNKLTPWE